MNPFKNHDYKHVLAYLACAIILGACFVIDPLKQNATIVLTIAAPLFLYAGISLPQAGIFSATSSAKKDDAGPKGGAIVLLLVGIGWGSMALTNVRDVHAPRALPALSLEACSGNGQQDAKTANDWINGFLNSAQYACTQVSPLTSAPQLAVACGIISAADKLAPSVEHFIESLILGREAQLSKGHKFDRARSTWIAP
jgi:hypothetical protein